MNEPEMSIQKWEDPIVAEVRRAREALFAAANHNLDKLCERLREEQKHSEHQVVSHSSSSSSDKEQAARRV